MPLENIFRFGMNHGSIHVIEYHPTIRPSDFDQWINQTSNGRGSEGGTSRSSGRNGAVFPSPEARRLFHVLLPLASVGAMLVSPYEVLLAILAFCLILPLYWLAFTWLDPRWIGVVWILTVCIGLGMMQPLAAIWIAAAALTGGLGPG
jgi:hypothetical protein